MQTVTLRINYDNACDLVGRDPATWRDNWKRRWVFELRRAGIDAAGAWVSTTVSEFKNAITKQDIVEEASSDGGSIVRTTTIVMGGDPKVTESFANRPPRSPRSVVRAHHPEYGDEYVDLVVTMNKVHQDG